MNDGRGGPGQSNFTAGSYTNGQWEVWQERRGDVARAMFYMAVRYEGGTHAVTGAPEPDLRLTDDRVLIDASNTGSNISVAYMGLLSVLLDWHDEDPVDLVEFQHHEAAAAYQGNRNPFIDHPEWVDCAFRDICGSAGDTTPPSPPSGISATADATHINLDWFDNAETDLAGYTVYRSQSSGGPYYAISPGLLGTSAYTDNSALPNTIYFYVMTATDVAGNESADSAEVWAQVGQAAEATVWINEFHYDNSGADRDEFIEVAGTAGTSLSGWKLAAYNGSNGQAYLTQTLAGVIPDQDNGYGTLSYPVSSLQNGSPDGIALIDDVGAVVEFVSYEGAFTAVGGDAAGVPSIDIGVSENGSTPQGWSLQLTGTGNKAGDFSWSAPQQDTPGLVNQNQAFAASGDTTPPAVPTDLFAMATSTTIQLQWNTSAASDFDHYTVYRAQGGAFSPLASPSTSQYEDTSAAVGLTYEYVVTAVDTSGNESAFSLATSATILPPSVPSAWINEVHYDNSGGDVGEFVEIAGTAGLNLAGWSLVAYNGNGGTPYQTVSLSGTLPNLDSGFGVLAFDIAGLQNGAPDGVALINDSGDVVEFLSYEGVLTATGGPASGQTSDDIGVSETSSTPIGHSLQKTGNGSESSDFTWQSPGPDSYGAINQGQQF